ncbi:hypothetical protein BOSE21B_20109 [Bosea sp. 21B]|nr:hypothetical protein BOSE21B_20109 [Bosea sp. 21B]
MASTLFSIDQMPTSGRPWRIASRNGLGRVAWLSLAVMGVSPGDGEVWSMDMKKLAQGLWCGLSPREDEPEC